MRSSRLRSSRLTAGPSTVFSTVCSLMSPGSRRAAETVIRNDPDATLNRLRMLDHVLLYNSPVSGNCYKVRLLFAHLGIDYERRDLDVVDRSNRRDVLGGLNPALRVPTLVLE